MNENDTRPLMVSIWCITYNHEPYIRQCLEGFVMQKTNFRFEAIVHDDASTDGTAAIVREYAEKYPDIIKPILETENQYSKGDGSLERIMDETCTGKYIAICEGDDYWIDPLKLQKQVDFLESHPDYTMCFHNAINFYVQNNEVSLFNHFELDAELLPYDAINNWFVPTASILVRKEYLQDPGWLTKIYSGDYSLILKALNGGRIYGLKDIMSIYRINTIGSSATARMVGKSTFIMEEHLKLLESFNNGTNYKFNKEVSSRIVFLKKNIKFQKLRERKSLLILFNYTLYEKCFLKIKRISKKIIECFRA